MTEFAKIPSAVHSPNIRFPWTQTLPGYSFVFVLLWVSAIAFPRSPSNELDSSWRMVLNYALDQNLQFGKDLIFTYGPLGFLMGRTYAGVHFYRLIVWQFLSSAVLAWVVLRTARNLSPIRSLFYYLYFLFFGTIYDDATYAITIVLLGLDLIRAAPKGEKITPLITSGFLAISSIMKFTNFLLAVIVLTSACIYNLITERRGRALSLFSVYGVTFLGTWMVVGQSPLNIPAYVFNSIEITKGYAEAMALDESSWVFYFGLVTVLSLVAYSVAYYVTHPDKIKAAFLVGIFGAATYLQWKNGFVRADGHVIGFFLYSLLPTVAFPAWLEDCQRLQKTKSCFLLIGAATSILGLYFAMAPVVTNSLSGFNQRITQNLESLARFSQLHRIYQERWKTEQSDLDMRRTRSVVGTASLDVLGYEQGVALYNGFHYTPRPIFQSYSAYSDRLIKANVEFFNPATAPKYVLQKYQTIDNRFPGLDDSRVLDIIFRDYMFVFVENNFLLWKRKSDSVGKDKILPKLQREIKVHFNESVELGDLQQGNLWLAVKYRPSLLGWVRTLLYKPPLVSITVIGADNGTRTFRIVGAMAEEGFLVNPLIESQFDLLRFISGLPGKRVTSLSIDISPSAQKFFRNAVELGFYSLPSLPPSEVQMSDYVGGLFRTVPVSITSGFPIEPAKIETADVLLVHAPSEMIFDVGPRSSAVSGRFGFLAGAYSNDGKTDGAEFSISWLAQNKVIPLFKRYLDPIRAIGDRDLQLFNLDLSNYGKGKLLFRTDPGPNHNLSWDWTVWSDIEIK